MSKICPPKEFANVKEDLQWQIREKELEVSRILSKTTFWHQKVDPATAREIAKKEEWLSNWYKSHKNYKVKCQSILSIEEALKKLNKEIFQKKRLMEDYYEKIGCFAIRDYQQYPKKWEAYENIFEASFKRLSSFAPQNENISSTVHSFLHSNFNPKNKLCSSLKRICRPVGEKVMQLNLTYFLYENINDLDFIHRAENQEKEYSALLKKKRTTESNRNHLKQELGTRSSWLDFFKSVFMPNTNNSPKTIMLELEEFYTNILNEYLEANPEKRPANLERALEELTTLKERKDNLELQILQSKKEKELKLINNQKIDANKHLEHLKLMAKRQEKLIRELEDKEKLIKENLNKPSNNQPLDTYESLD